MNRIDCPTILKNWYSTRAERWKGLGIQSQIKLPDDESVNKAVITFESGCYLASMTAWGTGTIESIVFDAMTKSEVRVSDLEYSSEDELHDLLLEHETFFISLIG